MTWWALRRFGNYSANERREARSFEKSTAEINKKSLRFIVGKLKLLPFIFELTDAARGSAALTGERLAPAPRHQGDADRRLRGFRDRRDELGERGPE